MIRSKQMAAFLLAASLQVVLTGCHTTVVQPVEVKHDPANDHHDDGQRPPPPPPPDRRPPPQDRQP